MKDLNSFFNENFAQFDIFELLLQLIGKKNKPPLNTL
jgi:hypothetical protein